MLHKKLKDIVEVEDLVLATLAEDVEFFDDSGPTVVHAGLRVFVNPHENYMVWGSRLVSVLPWQYKISVAC